MAIVNLSDTWILENYEQVFEKCIADEEKESPPLAALDHFAFPGLAWRIELYPRGDSNAMSNYASIFVRAKFGSDETSTSNVWAEWTLTIVAGDVGANLQRISGLEKYFEGRSGWGFSDAFLQDAVKAAARTDGHLQMKLDLSIYKLVDLLKCRQTVRALLSENQHADFSINLADMTFKAHKAILAKRSPGFLQAVPVGTTADAFSAFLGAVYYDQFNFLTNWEQALGVLRLSVEFGAVELEEFCVNALVHLIPALDVAALLQILPDAIRCNTRATKDACILALSQKKEILISSDWAKFKATEELHVFQAICDGLLALQTSDPDEPGAGELSEFSGDGLADLVPSLSLEGLLEILPAIIQNGKLATKLKAACIRVLLEKKGALNSAAWTRFKATEGLSVFQAICDALLEKFNPSFLTYVTSRLLASRRAPEVTFSHTWEIPHAALLTAIAQESAPITSPPFLEDEAYPLLECQLEIYPRGNTKDSDHKPGFASVYLKAVFGPTDDRFAAVCTKWKAAIVVNDELRVSIPGSSDFFLYPGAKEMMFSYANAFPRSQKYDEALVANNSSFAVNLELTIASIPEILKCRDLFLSLHSDKTYADIEIDVKGTIFKAHKCILAIRSPVFAEMFQADTNGKAEVKHTTPEAFRAFMVGVYYESWTFLSEIDATIGVLNLAERYAVVDLKQYCDDALAHFVNESNVVKILPHATIENANATKLACCEILFANEEMMKCCGWLKFKAFTDVEISVSGEICKANKSILSSRSVVFARMFTTAMKENKNGKVKVDETTPEAFEAFLSAVYYDSWSFLSEMDATIKVIKLAEQYAVADLKQYCDMTLAHFVEASTVLKILPYAALHNALAAKAACVGLLFASEELMTSSEWMAFKKANKEIAYDIAEALGERYRKALKRKREDD